MYSTPPGTRVGARPLLGRLRFSCGTKKWEGQKDTHRSAQRSCYTARGTQTPVAEERPVAVTVTGYFGLVIRDDFCSRDV